MSAKTTLRLLPLASLALVASCSGDSADAAGGSGSGDMPADPAGFEVQGDVLTEAEAEAQAAESLNAENADAEFEKLKEEIGG